jgi:hypothetical protein
MAVTQLFTSSQVTLNAGQTREIMVGSPAFVTFGVFYGVNVTPAAQLDGTITLVETAVKTDASATPRLFYTVRNNNQNQPVTFIRTAVQISP